MNAHRHLDRHLCNGDRKPEEPREESKLVAKQEVNSRSYMVIAMLAQELVKLSLKFHYNSGTNGHSTSETPLNSDESPSPNNSPRNSVFGGYMEKSVSLSPLARMSSPRAAVSTAVLNEQLIALGGYDRGECLDTVEVFDMTLNTWKPLQPMSTARGRFDVSQWEGQLYACGGSNGSHELKSLECYNSETDTWSPLPDMYNWRSSVGVTVLGGKLYVVGGWSGQNGQPECEMYDIASRKWTSIQPMNVGEYPLQ